MRTIEQGLNEAYKQAGENAFFGNGFKAGVEFAQRWIPVSEELPESNHKGKVLTKGLMGSMIKEEFIELAKYRNNKFSNEMDWKYVTHWRPINLE